MSFNPQIDQFKDILSDNADAVFNGYQIQSSVSGKRIYKEDEIYTMLDKARRNAEIIETQMLEVDMAYTDESGDYQSTMYDILITINEFLGENATISYDLYVKGDPVQGKTKITGGKPTFTAGE